jgi:hypothetical protein
MPTQFPVQYPLLVPDECFVIPSLYPEELG